MSQNDVDRQGGMNEAFITVSPPLLALDAFLTVE